MFWSHLRLNIGILWTGCIPNIRVAICGGLVGMVIRGFRLPTG